MLHGHSKYKNKEFIGSRDPLTGQYTYEIDDSIVKKAIAIGSALAFLSLLKEGEKVNGNDLKLVGIYAKNRPEWTMCDIANALYGHSMVPL